MILLRNPFIGSFQTEDFSIKEYEELIYIMSDSILEQKFPLFLFQVLDQLNCKVS
jgi:hypothetical protein